MNSPIKVPDPFPRHPIHSAASVSAYVTFASPTRARRLWASPELATGFTRTGAWMSPCPMSPQRMSRLPTNDQPAREGILPLRLHALPGSLYAPGMGR